MDLRRVLVPTDFSPDAERAARFAHAIALRAGGELSLLHVQPLPGFSTITIEPIYIPPSVVERLQRAQDRALREQMARLEEELGGGSAIHVVYKRGDVVDDIVTYASESQSDLIVIGSRGYGATRLLIGSVSLKVSRRAPCPVLIPRGDAVTERGAFERILVGIDYSHFSEPLVRAAAALAAPGATLELFHAWEEPLLSAFGLDMREQEDFHNVAERGRARHAHFLEEFAAELDLGDVEVRTSIESGRAPTAILDRASQIDADLVAVGAHAREGAVERLLGTVADRVLRHAALPVLLLPADAL